MPARAREINNLPGFSPWTRRPATASYAVRRVQALNPQLSPSNIHLRLWYSTFVSLDRRYLYYEVPKAACTSMKLLIHSLEKLPPVQPFKGPAREVRQDMFIHTRQNFHLSSLTDFDDQTQEHILTSPNFLRFTIVRNPYTRLQSAWSDKVQTCAPGFQHLYFRIKGSLPKLHDPNSFISLAEFVEAISKDDLTACDPHWRLQVEHVFLRSMNFNFIGRVESLHEAVSTFIERAGFGQAQISRAANSSPEGDIYDQALADRVYGLYERDFVDLGYPKGRWMYKDKTESTAPRTVSEMRYLDEISQRNIVIDHLYSERASLRQRVRQLEELVHHQQIMSH
jgi:hypothetical protein